MQTDPTRRHVMAGMLLASARGGAPAAPPAPSLPDFVSASLDNTVWVSSGIATKVGAVQVALSDGSSSAGTAVTCNNANFIFTNSSDSGVTGITPCDLDAKAGTPSGDYSNVILTPTKAGVGNSGSFTGDPLTLTGVTPGPAVALTRQIHNAGSGTPAVAFWNLGHPFVKSQVPTGSVVTATFGGAAVRVQGFSTKLEADGSFAWSDLHVDLSGQMPAPGASKDLVLSVASGSWPTTTNRTDADWAALVDTVEITNLAMIQGSITSITWASGIATVTTSAPHGLLMFIGAGGLVYRLPITGATPTGYNGTRNCTATSATTFTFPLGTNPGSSASSATYGPVSAADLDGAGTWIAAFDAGATNIIWPYGSGALGLRRRVTAPFYNGATKHRFLMAVMEYWATQKADGSLGPIMSIGPIIENCLAFKSNPTQFNYDLAYKRGGSTVRSETGVQHAGLAKMVLTRSDGRGDWTGTDPSIWVGQDYGLLGRTLKVPFYAPGIVYTGSPALKPTTPITGINTTSGVLSTAGSTNLFGPAGKRTNPVTFTAGSMPTGLTAGTKYWAAQVGVITGISWSAGTATVTTRPHGFPTSSVQSFTLKGTTNNSTFNCTITSGTQFTFSVAGSISLNGATGEFYLNNQFLLYDTLGHALAYGATGLVIPSTSGSAVVAKLSTGPSASAVLNQAQGNPGSYPDICFIPEWHAAYVVANTQAQQDYGRVTSFAWMSAPCWLLKDDTSDAKPHIVSCLSTALTPAGLLPAKQTSFWADSRQFSTDIGGGFGPTGYVGGWGLENSHMTHPVYIPWLLEGGAILQSIAVEHGARAVGMMTALAKRNTAIGAASPIYTGVAGVLGTFADPRAMAWVMDALGLAAFAAPQGSAEETMLRSVISQNVLAQQAYMTLKGTAYTDTGCLQYHEATNPPYLATNLQLDLIDPTFMHDYAGAVWPLITSLHEDFISGMATVAAYTAKRWTNAYNNNLGFYATAFRRQYCISDGNVAVPGVYAPSVAEVGLAAGDDARWSISTVDGTITINATSLPSWTVRNGDKFRPINYRNATGNTTPFWPSPFVDGTDYYFVNVNLPALTAQLAATQGGTAIIPTAGTINKTGATGAAGQKVILMSDTSGIIAQAANPYGAAGATGAVATNTTAPTTIPAGATVVSIVTNVSVTLSANLAGAGVQAGDSLTFKVSTFSGYFIPTQNGNPNTGTMATTGTGEDSYLATQVAGLAMHADRGVSGADTAYGSTTSGNVGAFPRYTGNNNVEAMWAVRRIA